MNNYNEQILNIAKANRKLLYAICDNYKTMCNLFEETGALIKFANIPIFKLKLLESLLSTIKITNGEVPCATINKNIFIKYIYFYMDHEIESKRALDKTAMKMTDVIIDDYVKILIDFDICYDNEIFYSEVYGFNEHGLLIDNNYIDNDLRNEGDIIKKSFISIGIKDTKNNLSNALCSYVDLSMFKTVYKPKLLKYITIKTIEDISTIRAIIKENNLIIKYIDNDSTFLGIIKNMYLVNYMTNYYNRKGTDHTLSICLEFESGVIAIVNEIIDNIPLCYNLQLPPSASIEGMDLVAEFEL